jgi:hypothetical protein
VQFLALPCESLTISASDASVQGTGGGPLYCKHVFAHPFAAVFWPLLHVAVYMPIKSVQTSFALAPHMPPVMSPHMYMRTGTAPTAGDMYLHEASSVAVDGGGAVVAPVAAAHVFGHPTAAVFWPLLHIAVYMPIESVQTSFALAPHMPIWLQVKPMYLHEVSSAPVLQAEPPDPICLGQQHDV